MKRADPVDAWLDGLWWGWTSAVLAAFTVAALVGGPWWPAAVFGGLLVLLALMQVALKGRDG